MRWDVLPLAALATSLFADELPPLKNRSTPNTHEKYAAGVEAVQRESPSVCLMDRCGSCHGVDVIEGELDLTDRAGSAERRRDGTGYRSQEAGRELPDEVGDSQRAALHAVRRREDAAGGDRPATKIGSNWAPPTTSRLTEEKIAVIPWQEREVADDADQFWSFQKLKVTKPPPQSVQDESWLSE